MSRASKQPPRPKASPRLRPRLNVKDVVFYGALAVLAALVGYAVLGPKGGGPHQAGTAGPNTTAPPAWAAAGQTGLGQPAAAPSSGPRIQLASLTYDFGRATGDALVPCVFTFTNVGTEWLQLHTVEPLCGCFRAGDWPRQVAPGGTGAIPIQLDTRNYIGPFAKSIRVTCNDPAQSNLLLQVKGYVWRPIEITPLQAMLSLTEETPSNAVTVRLISHLDEPLALSELQCTAPGVGVDLLTNQPGKEYHLLVKTLPPWPTNRVQGKISLKTSTELMPTVTVPVFVNMLPLVSAVPSVVRLPSLPLTNELTFNTWIRNNSTNPITVSEPTINVPGVDLAVREEQPGRQFSVSLRFPAGFDVVETERMELILKVNHPKVPVIKVPVVTPARAAPAPAAKPDR